MNNVLLPSRSRLGRWLTLAGSIVAFAATHAQIIPESSLPVGRLGASQFITPVNQRLTPAGKQLELPNIRPEVLALSPDGRLLVTSGQTHELIAIDPQNAQILQHVPLPADAGTNAPSKPVSEAVLNPDLKAQASYTGLAFSPDGSKIYLAN